MIIKTYYYNKMSDTSVPYLGTIQSNNEDKECFEPNCTNEGAFDGDRCPGSDDENHHCEECGELWWDDKGCYCEICNKYYCPTYWQNNFIRLDGYYACKDCNKKLEDMYFDWDMGICPECFYKHKEYWCKSNNPKCKYNIGHVQTNIFHCKE